MRDDVSSMIKTVLDDKNIGVYIVSRGSFDSSMYNPMSYSLRYTRNIYCGVYWLFDKDEVVYIGFSEDLRTRLRSHSSDSSKKEWDRAKVVLVDSPRIARAVESTLLLNFKTRYNSPRSILRWTDKVPGDTTRSYNAYNNFRGRVNMILKFYGQYGHLSKEELANIGIGLVYAFEDIELYRKHANTTFEQYVENFKLKLKGQKHDLFLI
jgi:hypothetical protein